MKRLFPIALMLCLFVSLTSFAPVQPTGIPAKKNVFVTFPITGQTGSTVGLLDYEISGSSGVPSNITFYLAGTSTVVVSKPFTVYPSSPNSWIATDLRSTTGITAVIYHATSWWPNYAIEIISPF